MAANRALSNLALAMMALPMLLGACLCWVRPERAWLWALAMVAVPVAALGKTTVRARLLRAESTVDARTAISGAVIVSSWVAASLLAGKLAGTLGTIEPSLADAIAIRWANFLVGGYFVLCGDRLPKVLTPLSDLRGDPANIQTLQRRTGWILILAGLAYAVLWLFLPIRLAWPIGLAVMLGGFLAPSVVLRSLTRGGRSAL